MSPDGRHTETYYATSCDISKGGVGFRMREPLPPFTPVRICRAGEMVGMSARTLSNTQTLTGFIIGAEFRFEQETAAEQRVAKTG